MTLFEATRSGLLGARVPDRIRVATRLRAAVWSRRTFLVAVSCLFALGATDLACWWLDGAVVPWDSKNHFYPMFRFLGDALRHGTVPLWNPYHFAGYPAVADPQSLIFTPSMMLFALIAPDASIQVFDAVIMLHLILGGVGMLGLARRWRWHPAASLLGAIVFMLGGAASSRLQHTGMIISYAWFPLALWSLQAALDRRSLRLAVLAGVVATLMALGRDQVAYLLCLALLGAVCRQALRSGDMLAYVRGRLPVLVCAGIVTIVLMAVPILLTLQFVHGSNRPGIAYGMALEGSLDPVNLITLFAPNVFGSLDRIYDYWGPGAATVAGDDWTDRSIDYLFAGTLPIVLLAWHGLAGGRLAERGARYFVLLFLAACVYALGRHTPMFEAIFDWVPGVSLYRRPADATFLMNVALALATGYLLHRFIEEGLPKVAVRMPLPAAIGWPIAWSRPLATVVAGAVLVGSSLAFAQRDGHLHGSLAQLVLSAGLATGVVGALCLFRARGKRETIALVLVLLTAAELLWRNAASPLNAEPASTYSADTSLYPDEAKGLAVLQREIAARTAMGQHPRLEILGVNGSWQNASMIFKLENTVGYNPLRIADYEHAIGPGESAVDPNLRAFPDTFRGYNSRMAGLLGLDYLVLGEPIADLPRHFPRPRATMLFGGDHFYVYRLDHPSAPRVYVATHVRAVDSDGLIENGTLPDFDVGAEALVEQADVGRLTVHALLDDATPGPASRATITAYEDNRVAIAVDAAADGVLVLHDINYPGWVARVDGKEVPILRTNVIFRGLEVPAGHHTVEFTFQPLALKNLVAAGRDLWGKESE